VEKLTLKNLSDVPSEMIEQALEDLESRDAVRG
jgi:hypothetical protein